MQKRSAGLLMYRRRDDELEVFLVHPGGPYLGEERFRRVVDSKGGIHR